MKDQQPESAVPELTLPELYEWHYLHGEPTESAIFKQTLDDFIVEETLRFEPSGEGAHHLLYIEKKNVNTDIVCHKLQKFAEVKPTDIGYAGKKDRFAVARQWFSVQLPLLKDIDWQEFNDDEVTVLSATRHDKKVRIGAVKSNQFTITLNDFTGDKDAFNERLEQIKESGFPNYFGEQRFGRDRNGEIGTNLSRGVDVLMFNKRLKNRNLQGLLFSAVRSFLFNHVVSERIGQELARELLSGDFVMLSGSEKGFVVQELEVEAQRYKEGDVLLTAPLAGSRPNPQYDALDFEAEALLPYQQLIDKLANKRFNEERRALIVFPQNVTCQWHNDSQVELSFSLPKGAFATSLLRELVELRQMHPNSSE